MPRTTRNSAAAWLAVALLSAPAQRALCQELPLAPSIDPSSAIGARAVAPSGSRELAADPLQGDLLRGGQAAGDGTPRGATAEDATPGAANYGAPRPRTKLPKPYPPRRAHAGASHPSKNPLPPLQAYKTSAGARRSARQHLAPDESAPPPGPTVAAAPIIKTKPKPTVEPNPYDPVGVGIGSLRLTPFVETSAGYDSNPDRLSSSSTPTPTGSKLLRTDAGFKLRSDWARDDFQADLRLGYVDYLDYEQASRPDGVGNFTGRYDVTRDTAIDVLGHFTLDTQRPDAPAISSGLPNVTVTNRPIIFSAGVGAGATQKFNRLEVSLRGTFDRTIYENATYSDGSILNLASTDYNDYGVTGRVAYDVSPSFKPFAEGTYDSRVHDALIDPYGYDRDSTGFAARGGAEVKITDLLRGQAAGGYAERDYQDVRLPQLHGPTIDASLIYTPTPLTTLTLRGATALNETTLPGASGAISRSINVELAHDLFRNLTLTAVGGYSNNQYQGVSLVENAYTAGVKLDYKITRSFLVRASYSREHLSSNTTGDDYTANVFLVGLRFQP
ncbi:MAG: outer membrane beta-barrel protein [Methylocystis sp.]